MYRKRDVSLHLPGVHNCRRSLLSIYRLHHNNLNRDCGGSASRAEIVLKGIIVIDNGHMATWTSWTGLDPEFISDQQSTPQVRSFTFGLKLDL